LSTNYYLTEKDIGSNRVNCHTKLAELNPYVKVNVSTDNLMDLLSKTVYDVVILFDHDYETAKMINELTRKPKMKFMLCNIFGGFGNIFCDFGEEFKVNDVDGEEPKNGMITEMFYEGKKVTMTTGEAHNLSSDDVIKVSCFDDEFIVKRIVDRSKFELEFKDEKTAHEIMTNTHFMQVKQPKTLKFKSLSESYSNPEMTAVDMTDFSRASTLHALYQAVNDFEVKNKRLPEPWSEKDSELVTENVVNIFKDANKSVVKSLVQTIQGQLCPLHAFFGSVCAQEVMKACSGKFHPIYQWLYHDICDVIPKEKPKMNLEITNRYDGQRLVFGDEFQEKLKNAKLFIVGSGAIGCEHLKNFGMIGVGNMVTTDMDTIERSNLNRQFLFRNFDIGKFKSETAAAAIKKINPDINVTAQQNRVGQETLNIYNEEFFKSLTCVANALDNVQARKFVDSLCVNHQKPLLESGTLGTKGNVQTVVPHLTESYGSTSDPPEKDIPVCTIKNFPYEINHCIQWSRELFEGYFNKSVGNAMKYLTKDAKNELKNMTPTEVICINEDIKQVLKHLPKTYDDCLDYAFEVWHELFRNQIQQMRYKFPTDAKTAEGAAFWSGTKKCPNDLKFNVNKNNTLFLLSFANLWAFVFNIPLKDKTYVESYVSKLKIPDFSPSDEVSISVTEEEEKKKKEKSTDGFDIEEIVKSLPDLDLSLSPVSFEKDDDSNFHIDFITSSSNLRAENYQIQQADRHKVKGIAGKIIPAIATTTSLVSSLVTIEFYKVLLGFEKLDFYRNAFINLALPFFGMSEPMSAEKSVNKIGSFTFWDSVNFDDVTLGDIIDAYEDKYKSDVGTIAYESMLLYADHFTPKKIKDRRSKLVKDVYKEIAEKEPVSPLVLTVLVNDETNEKGEEVSYDVPQCKVYF